ncbi:hypothetical protein ACLOJK_010948 [Asimina triloba]
MRFVDTSVPRDFSPSLTMLLGSQLFTWSRLSRQSSNLCSAYVIAESHVGNDRSTVRERAEECGGCAMSINCFFTGEIAA